MPNHDVDGGAVPQEVLNDQDEGGARFLTFREVEKVYDADDPDEVFRDIIEEFPLDKVKASVFGEVATSIGTHSLKFITTKAAQGKDGQSVFTAGQDTLMFSGNAAFSKYAKVLLRPIRFAQENASRSMMERLFMSGGAPDIVSAAFARMFGDEVLEAVRAAAFPDSDAVTGLPARNCPVIFLPHPGGDIQATPVSPMIAFNRIKGETSRFFRKREKGEAGHIPRGDFVFSSDTSKMQLMSPQVSGLRRRFRVSPPTVCEDGFAGVYKFAKTRRMPPIWDEDVASALIRFVDLNAADMSGASSSAVSSALDNLITFLSRRVITYATDICEAAREVDADFIPPPLPDVRGLLLPGTRRMIVRDLGREAAAHKEAELRAALSGRGARIGFNFADAYAAFRVSFGDESPEGGEK